MIGLRSRTLRRTDPVTEGGRRVVAGRSRCPGIRNAPQQSAPCGPAGNGTRGDSRPPEGHAANDSQLQQQLLDHGQRVIERDQRCGFEPMTVRSDIPEARDAWRRAD
jgi:hypothetical protein